MHIFDEYSPICMSIVEHTNTDEQSVCGLFSVLVGLICFFCLSVQSTISLNAFQHFGVWHIQLCMFGMWLVLFALQVGLVGF